MTLVDWHRLPVGTPVELKVGDGEPFVGNVVSSTRASVEVIGEDRETRWERWPRTRRQVLHEEPTRLQWIDDRWRTHTLTIQKESRCAT